MIPQTELDRFYALRQFVFDNIKRELEIDSHCKSYEGAMAIQFPDYFDGRMCEPWAITLDCYVFGPSRHYRWEGDTFLEALEKAEKEIKSWEHETT